MATNKTKLFEPFKSATDCEVTYRTYAVKFNQPDNCGVVHTKESVNETQLEQLKFSGEIIDYKIDDTGVMFINKFALRSVDLSNIKSIPAQIPKAEFQATFAVNALDLIKQLNQAKGAMNDFGKALEKMHKIKTSKWYQFWKR